MSRRRLLLAIVVVVLVLVMLAVVRPRTYYPFLPNGHAVVMKSERDHLATDASFPEFGRPVVDATLRTLVTDVLESLAIDSADHPHSPNATDEVTVTYRVPYRTLWRAGVIIDVSVDSEHPSHFVIVRTLDLWRDHIVTVGDFAISTQDPLRAAAQAIQVRLQNREGIDPKRVSQNLKPTLAVLSDFIARPDGLEFYFNPGMLAVPERGIIVVNVPWTSLAHDLKP